MKNIRSYNVRKPKGKVNPADRFNNHKERGMAFKLNNSNAQYDLHSLGVRCYAAVRSGYGEGMGMGNVQVGFWVGHSLLRSHIAIVRALHLYFFFSLFRGAIRQF